MPNSGPTILDTTHSTMRITIDERGGRTQAKVELNSPSGRVAGVGIAYRHPSDYLKDDARLQMATARALSNLAGQLVTNAARP
jgi:hypothetical protein